MNPQASTVAAIASAPGVGAVSLIRVSGPDAVQIVAEVTRCKGGLKNAAERYATLCKVVGKGGEVIDEVLATVFGNPRSFTGEDVVELACHGGVLVTRRVLERLLECGARSADPGEFSRRAFENGKLDLTQAEGIMDLISAQTDLAMRAAHEQMQGKLGDQSEVLREKLIGVVAHVEAFIDFPDGLLGYERAIVSDVKGTTRDTVEEVVNIQGIPLRLIDTAGVRSSEDKIEQQGIIRSEKQIELADLIIEVVDGSKPGKRLLTEKQIAGRKHVFVINKKDLGLDDVWKDTEGVHISCSSESSDTTDQDSLALLGNKIADILMLNESAWGGHAVAINARHQECLNRGKEALSAARDGLESQVGAEFAALDLRDALDAIGEVAGRVDTEEIFDAIFGAFCIGK